MVNDKKRSSLFTNYEPHQRGNKVRSNPYQYCNLQYFLTQVYGLVALD